MPSSTLSRNYTSNVDILSRYEPLELPEDAVQLTYIWIDGRQGVRHKSKTIDFVPHALEDVPNWVFATDWFYNLDLPLASEIVLLPVRLYNDPFNGADEQKMVFCQAVLYGSLEPIPDNMRNSCCQVLERVKHQKPRFLIDQEYYLFDGNDRHRPLGWPEDGGRPTLDGPYYCGVGAGKVSGRDVVEAHYRACMYAGVSIVGTSAGDILGKWTFTIGSLSADEGPITVGDDLWMARFLLQLIAEDFNVTVTFDLKIFPNQSDQQNDDTKIHFSTAKICSNPSEAQTALHKLQTKFQPKLDYSGYPSDLNQRMSALNVTNKVISNTDPKIIQKEDGSLYLVEQRIASNMDPYSVCEQMIRAIC